MNTKFGKTKVTDKGGKRGRRWKILVNADTFAKRPTKGALWLFGGLTFTRKKVCGNFLTLLFMLKSIKISPPLTNELSKALLATL